MGSGLCNSAFSEDADKTRPRTLTLLNSDVQADRIDTRNGNLVVQHRDVFIPGNGGLNLEVWRRYDMLSASSGLIATHSFSHRWAAMGPGWTVSAAPKILSKHSYSLDADEKPYYSPTGLDLLCNSSLATASIWGGPTLQHPNGDEEEIFSAPNQTAYTKSNWKISCVGGRMTASSPDGITYDFGLYSARKVGIYKQTNYDAQTFDNELPLPYETYFLANSARDASGNTLTYSYKNVGAAIPPWPYNTQPPASSARYVPYSPTPLVEMQFVEASGSLLTSISSSDGRKIDFNYDSATQKLTSITDNSGRRWSYTYQNFDSNNTPTLIKAVSPEGEAWSYGYAPGAFQDIAFANGTMVPALPRKLVKLTNPTGGTASYEYGTYSYADRITSGSGWTLFTQQGERVISRTLSNGAKWTYAFSRGVGTYDTTVVSAPEGSYTYKYMGAAFKMRYQASQPTPAEYQNNAWQIGQLMSLTDPLGNTETYTWDKRIMSTAAVAVRDTGGIWDLYSWAPILSNKVISRNGVSSNTTYSNFDTYGNPATKTESGPNGGSRITSYTYFNDPTKWIIGKVASETSPGKSLTRTFDANGNVLTETRDGITTSLTYDAQGNIASKTTPRGGVYTYGSYKRGIAQTENRPENINITRVVDNAGNITAQTNGEGRTTLYTYDGMNRVTSITPPLGNPRTIVYTPTSKTITRGPLVEVTQYDPFGRTASITLAGIARTYTYDGLGRKTFESNPGAMIGTSYMYDALNRLTRQTNADGTFQTHSYGPATTSVTDERGNLTTYTYRSYGDPDQQLLMAIATPEASANVTIERGANDLMTAVTQAGLKRTYGYDSHNYLNSASNPETGLTTYGRDLAGNMTSKQVGASGITQYTYDALDRLTSTTYPGATPAITNTYNKNSKLLSSNSAGGNRSFAYDAADNLVQDSLALDGRVFTAHFAYDGNDSLSSTTYPQSSRVVSYVPDALGRPTTVSGYINDIKYWPSGLIQSITYKNGNVSRYGQNSRLWPASFTTEKPFTATYLNSNYTYDGIGNLATISDDVDASFNRKLGYDGINRLTNVAGFWGQGNIAYDGGGNLINQTLGQASLAYTYDANNRLSSVSGLRTGSYGYDVYGNVNSSQGNTYIYNDVPNLTCINCINPAAKVEYSYDGLNHRSAVVKASGKVYEMYDSDGKQLIELDGGKLTEYFYLGDKRVAQQVSP